MSVQMKIGVPTEVIIGESRVAATPKSVGRLLKQGFHVSVQSNAGIFAGFTDLDYQEAGATIASTASDIYGGSDLVLKVREPNAEEVSMMPSGLVLMCYLSPGQNLPLLQLLAEQGVNSIAMDAIPRISRAQKMDVLSSMANISGYRAVVEAAFYFGRFLNGQITAAGKVEPAKVLVVGAGVAGLAAIGTANSLGAIVKAFDTRKEVAEQIQSMGAKFLTVDINEDGRTESGYSKEMSQEFIDAEMKLFAEQAKDVDIVITTAQIPGRPAPKLWLDYHVKLMKKGSIVVDLAASSGGNCMLTKPGEVYTTDNGVTILGKVDLLPGQASQLYGNNLCHLLDDMGKAELFHIDMEDAIVSRAMVTHNGKINWPPKPLEVSPSAKAKTQELTSQSADTRATPENASRKKALNAIRGVVFVGALLALVGSFAPQDFLQHFTVFVLAVFIGWQVITNVAHALHTPLMAVTNAISGIIVIGGLLQTKDSASNVLTILSMVAILLATVNIVGGFLVTHRMLKMFRK
jgi:H+-translocating NAD(P) transhydrogenase subunit alpha